MKGMVLVEKEALLSSAREDAYIRIERIKYLESELSRMADIISAQHRVIKSYDMDWKLAIDRDKEIQKIKKEISGFKDKLYDLGIEL